MLTLSQIPFFSVLFFELGFALTRPYNLSHTPKPFLLYVFFSNGSCIYAWTMILLLKFLVGWDDRHMPPYSAFIG
jgi:hypothetical protein